MTAPSNSVTPLRYKIRKLTYKALMLTGGKPGLSKADQMIVLDNQIELLEAALATAKEARKIVAERDFDAYLAEKAKPSYDTLSDKGQADATKMSFDQIVSALSGDAPAPEPSTEFTDNETKDEGPQPPF
jgi:DNA-binding ferritin-like protein (Dps family)